MTIILINSENYGERRVYLDDEDLAIISGRQWSLSGDGRYAVSNRNNELIYMHRLICQNGSAFVVDHINMNTLDNRRINLRLTDKSGNEQNKEKRKGSHSSKYKGVVFDKNRKTPWRLRISVGGKSIGFGDYPKESIAAYFYNEFASSIYGDFFRPNLIPECELDGIDLEKYRKASSKYYKMTIGGGENGAGN